MQIVDVAGDDQELAWAHHIEHGERLMRGVGRRGQEFAAAQIIEFLDTRRVAREALLGHDVFEA